MTPPIPKNEIPCRLCGSSDSELFATTREHEYEGTTDEEFTVVRCKACGLIYLNPQPDVSSLPRIYPPGYACHDDLRKADVATLSGRLKARLAKRLGPDRAILQLARQIGADRIGTVLDIGCGSGRMLDAFRSALPGVVTHGLDYSPEACAIARAKGHRIAQTLIEDADYPAESFDLIYSSNVIEHIADPRVLMRKAAAWLRPGGYFLCETPNVDGTGAALFGRSGYWGGYHAPRHWTFFSPATLTRLASDEGFETARIAFVPVPIFWMWTFHHILLRASGSRGLADALMPVKDGKWNRPWSFVVKSFFTAVDVGLGVLGRRSCLMSALLRKPEKR